MGIVQPDYADPSDRWTGWETLDYGYMANAGVYVCEPSCDIALPVSSRCS